MAEAFVNIFSQEGILDEILSDRGSNFIFELMKEIERFLLLRQITTTPYHPMANGLVENFNGTLKIMLRRMCTERPKDWDRYLAPLLFASNEIPQASLGFSSFEVEVYGRNVKWPLSILRELWDRKRLNTEAKSTYQFALDLRNRIEDTRKLAHEELERYFERYEGY